MTNFVFLLVFPLFSFFHLPLCYNRTAGGGRGGGGGGWVCPHPSAVPCCELENCCWYYKATPGLISREAEEFTTLKSGRRRRIWAAPRSKNGMQCPSYTTP